MSSNYLAVLKALYDYETPQSDDELAIKEDQLLFLLEKVDEEQVSPQSGNYWFLTLNNMRSWWKVKIKPDSPDEDGPIGLVPAAYVEEVDLNMW
jgi:actin cytoskeleton-regulatory complex protein SLA1